MRNPLIILFHQFKQKKWSLGILLLFILLGQSNIGFSQSIPSYVPKNGLVGWWPFNGNANDESGNGNNGSVNGATLTTDRFGNANKAYDFNGSSFIKVLHNNMFNFGVNDYTLSAWAMRKGGDFLQNIISKELGYPTFKGWSLNFINNYPRFEPGTTFNSSWYSNGNINNIGGPYTNSISNDVWYHLVAVFNPTNSLVKLYINGTLAITRPISGSLINPDNLNDLFFGVYQKDGAPSGPEFLTGKIDDIGIYNRALTDGEISDLFNNNIVLNANILNNDTAICKGSGIKLSIDSLFTGLNNQNALPGSLQNGLVAYYPFNGNANDESGNSNNGKVNSGVTITTDRFGIPNSAYDFNGGTIEIPSKSYLSISQTGAFSVSLWIMKTGSQNPVHIIGKRASGAQTFNWQIAQHTSPAGKPGGGLVFTGVINSTSTGVDYAGKSDSALQLNQWELLVGTYNNGKWKLYKNGLLIAQKDQSVYASDAGTPPLEIGNCGNWGAFFGKIDDVSIYNRALTQTEVQQLYSSAPSVKWSTGDTTYSIKVTPTKTTKYYCTVSNGVESSVDSVTVTVINKPTASFTFQNNCVNVPVIFSNSSTVSQSGSVKYAWSFGNGVISSQSSPSDQIYKAEGSYTAKLVITPTACPSLSDSSSKIIKIVIPEVGIRYPAINLIKNVPFLLQARNIGVSYSWLPLSGISDPRISNPSFNSSVGADYRINIINSAGCTTVDSILIRAFDQTGVYVPKAFAPNGNGSNDILRPILVRITSINYFRIYNRWGQLIYQTKNIGEGWDGKYKGATQPTETYTWVFEGVDYNGKVIRESGKTTLLR